MWGIVAHRAAATKRVSLQHVGNLAQQPGRIAQRINAFARLGACHLLNGVSGGFFLPESGTPAKLTFCAEPHLAQKVTYFRDLLCKAGAA
jgi:hypothetical protein